MKLGELRAAIRAAKGNPTLQVTLPGSTTKIKLGVMKMILLQQLELAYPLGKMQETGLSFDGSTMMLSFEPAPEPVASDPVTSPTMTDLMIDPEIGDDFLEANRLITASDLNDLF